MDLNGLIIFLLKLYALHVKVNDEDGDFLGAIQYPISGEKNYTATDQWNDRHFRCRLRPSQGSQLSQHQTRQPFTILVEGNVGCGKSTLLEYFSSNPNIQLIREPVTRWQNENGTNFLDLMLKNETAFSLPFQVEAMLTRMESLLEKRPEKAKVRIMERSLYSGRYVFAKMQHDRGDVSDVENALMDRWFEFLKGRFQHQMRPDLIVYLQSDLDVLLKRIKMRNRIEENNIDIEFVKEVGRNYDNWLFYRNSSFPVPAPAFVVEANQDLKGFHKTLSQLKYKIIPKRLHYILDN